MKNTKICPECNKEFPRPMVDRGYKKLYPLSITLWRRRIYCSNSCSARNRDNKSGSESARWSGDSIGYRGIHHWIRKELGKADSCFQCGANDDTMKIHWANRDHKYKRNVEDWLKLCPKCHYQYDKNNHLRK